jgi:hypothetical protein
MVLKLHKALYGLKQAPRAWNAKLDSSLLTLGFSRSECEHGLYTRGNGESRLVVGIYVDDLIITGKSGDNINAFKVEMKTLFRMSDLGVLSYYLGIEVRQGWRGVELSQAAYAKKVLYKAGMNACNPCTTPMETRLKLSKQSTSPAVNTTEYRSLIGSLRYLMNTRPDLAFAVGYLSRFMENPRQEHMAAMKHLLRYVAGVHQERRRPRSRGLQRQRYGGGHRRQKEHERYDLLPRQQPCDMAILEAARGGTVVVRGGVHRRSGGNMPGSLAQKAPRGRARRVHVSAPD